MKKINLLTLEDDDTLFADIHKTNLAAYNTTHSDLNFEYDDYRASTVEEAIELLSKEVVFHASIIDLKLTGDTASDAKGNQLVKLITEKYRIPVIIYSNNISMLDTEFEGKSNSLFKAYAKSDKGMMEILNEIVELYNTGIIDILGKRGKIDEILNTVFWNHLSHSIPHWVNHKEPKEVIEKMILRHASEYLMRYLEVDESTGRFELFNSAETYLMPPVSDRLFTGNVIAIGNKPKYLLLSPACDMDLKKKNTGTGPIWERKAEFILALELVHWRDVESFNSLTPKTGKSNQHVTKLKGMISNDTPRFHFLPKFNSIDAHFVDFQKITSIAGSELEAKIEASEYSILASISSPFLKDIIARFSYYYSRQGSPDLNVDEVYASLVNEEIKS